MKRWRGALAAGAVLLAAAGCARTSATVQPAQVAPVKYCDPSKLEALVGSPCPAEGASCGVCPNPGDHCHVLVCRARVWQWDEVPTVPPPGGPTPRTH